jgi:hypothetical protein
MDATTGIDLVSVTADVVGETCDEPGVPESGEVCAVLEAVAASLAGVPESTANLKLPLTA